MIPLEVRNGSLGGQEWFPWRSGMISLEVNSDKKKHQTHNKHITVRSWRIC